jgi:pimeloyl-ACP methyl ester carboxylesterase
MDFTDDQLIQFEATGSLPLPQADAEGFVDHDGARIHYASYGSGAPIIMLHGGLGNGGNWGFQVPAIMASGRQAILIDSRGHGRSTRDDRPYTYQLMASDVFAVMDALRIETAAIIGWSDGACIGMVMADEAPQRVAVVFFFGCNMDPSGTLPFVPNPIIDHCFSRHRQDYAALSSTPDQFDAFVEAVGQMQRTEPNYSPADLARIKVPVAIVQSENDEFIKPEHARYLAETIPGAEFIPLPGVSHFAPLQRPALFNAAMLGFLDRIGA